MDMIIALIAITANVLTLIRLISYRRGGSRYKFGASLLAYLLLVASGVYLLALAFNLTSTSIWAALVSLVVSALVWRARGNCAAIVRKCTHEHYRHHGGA
ncbi:phage holin family protein [Pusillimonas noertemannii]|uniref:Putative 3TM holin n=1 Tax=Pusillimonas noertemannii TaxID=305977 RepID=A0A2U1CMD8_9BURK|nr:phage holin family protein [Pusillimonas noertemannii]NYT68824.1 phage holin family protein [Pusillimonas noertemannii]PVY62152.1 putative 3TM holin [Pusillimonas noertemannii]TFL10859.1 phage holin family protein [Pusillimonas noertemannii]